MARSEFMERERRRRAELFADRMADFQPRIVTEVGREQTEFGWRVIMFTLPPVLLGEGLTEAEAIEIQQAKLDELGQLLPSLD